MRFLAVLLLAASLAGCSASRDERGPSLASAPAQPLAALPQEVPVRAYAAFVMDARTGKVLHDTAGRSPRYPASLTKMMTLYMVFEKLEAGAWTTRTALPVSEEAASRPPSKLGVRAGEAITVDIAIRALAVRSANDVSVVVAEAISGSEEAFAAAMTRKARALGMMQTNFANASGLPEPRGLVTTARDIAILGKRRSRRSSALVRLTSRRRSVKPTGGAPGSNHTRLLANVDGIWKRDQDGLHLALPATTCAAIGARGGRQTNHRRRPSPGRSGADRNLAAWRR